MNITCTALHACASAFVGLLLLAHNGGCTPHKETAANPNALTQAQTLAEEGKYEEALEKHVWFHDHGLERNPAMYGVRLSFALSDWVALGEKYPKALEVLKEIRDKKTERLAGGDSNRELFHDVASINREIGEQGATVSLFKKLDSTSPAFASSVYDLADEYLVEGGEYALAKKHMGDPMARLAKAKERYDQGMQHAKESRSPDAARQAHEKIFAAEACGLINILEHTSDLPLAKRVQSEALKTVDSPKIRAALN